MSVELSLKFGWWIAPFALSIVSVVWAVWPRENERPNGSMFDGFAIFPQLIRLLSAVALSLMAWLIWALVR